MTDRSDGYPWCLVDKDVGWRLDEEYRGYMTEGWGGLRNVTLSDWGVETARRLNVSPEAYASAIKEAMDEMDEIDGR
jgi:hypothetical protein